MTQMRRPGRLRLQHAGPRARFRRGCLALSLAVGIAVVPSQAQAWDPSTTAQAILDAAIRRSAVHVGWMEASGLQFGLFSPVRMDPTRLDPTTAAWLRTAIEHAHADVGAIPRGGPGACPGADAPTELMRDCVRGDLWELDAIGWLRLGILAEGEPKRRLLHHFVNAGDATQPVWFDRSGTRKATIRRFFGRWIGAPLAARFTRTQFEGSHASAVAFFEDPDEPLGPYAVAAHQRLAALSSDPLVREHHRAMSLVAAGASLRVLMDGGLPAYARADLSAFLVPLSRRPGDRGDAMSEYVRTRYGRDLPVELPAPGTAPAGRPMAADLRTHLAGDADAGVEGLAVFSRSHFLSSGTLPAPANLDGVTRGDRALARWLGDDDLGLDPVELEGAKLTPWPAERGYAVNAAGRPLFAFSKDERGRVRAFVDTAIFADAASHLLPKVVDYTASGLDLLLGATQGPRVRASGSSWEIPVREDQLDAKLHVFAEEGDGRRRRVAQFDLPPGSTQRMAGLRTRDPSERVLLVVEWTGPDGITRAREFSGAQGSATP